MSKNKSNRLLEMIAFLAILFYEWLILNWDFVECFMIIRIRKGFVSRVVSEVCLLLFLTSTLFFALWTQ